LGEQIGESLKKMQPKANAEERREDKKLGMLAALMETVFISIEGQLGGHKWQPIMAKHQELSVNNLAEILSKSSTTEIQMVSQPLNNKIEWAHHVFFLIATGQHCRWTTSVTTKNAMTKVITFATNKAICTWKKKGWSFFVLANASNKNKPTMPKETKKMLNNG